MIIRKLFSDRRFNKKISGLVLPIALQNFMVALVGAADTFMLCRYGQDAMAAVALATQVQFVHSIITGALLSGLSIMGAQYWGKKNIPVMEKLLAIGISLTGFTALAFFGGCFFMPEELMKFFASDPVLINAGAEYLRIVSVSFFFYGISRCYLTIMRVSDHVRCSVVINIMTVLLNVIFNAIFIFGLFGAPAWGVKGAAFATSLAGIIEMFAVMLLSLRRDFIMLRIRKLFAFDKALFTDYLRYTIPIMGSLLLWGIGFTSYTAIIGHLGKEAAAANAIAAVARSLGCCVCDGLALGTSIMVGHELGAGNLRRGKLYGSRAFVLSFLIGGCTSFLLLIALPVVSGSAALTGEANNYLHGMFYILAVYMIGRSVSAVGINGVLAAGGDTLFNVYSIVVAMWCFALPCAMLGAFYFHWPVVAVFACTCLDEISKMPWLIWHYRKYKWVRNITE
jgi:putative MATE family efflux protein